MTYGHEEQGLTCTTPPELQQAGKCLDRAKEIVTKERNQTHGNVLDTHRLIGKLWGDYLGIDISALDVTQLMVLLKLARARMGNRGDLDHYIDQAGYAACAAAVLEAEAIEDDQMPRSMPVGQTPSSDHQHQRVLDDAHDAPAQRPLDDALIRGRAGRDVMGDREAMPDARLPHRRS